MRIALNVHTVLLRKARILAHLGRPQDALNNLTRLLTMRKISRQVVRRARTLMGELHLNAERFRSARRALREALKIDPEHARSRYLLGLAIERDINAEPKHAVRHFRAVLRAKPNHPRTLAALGRVAFRLNRVGLALKYLRQAHALRPDDQSILESYCDVLYQEERFAEARKVLIAVRFRKPNDQVITRLWGELLSARLMSRKRVVALPAGVEATIPPVLIPFPAAETTTTAPVRRDTGHQASGPHFHKLSAYRLKQRRAK